MRKRGSPVCVEDEPPQKKSLTSNQPLSNDLRTGEVLTDISGKQWKLGKAIGIGGFGEIFLVSDNLESDVGEDSNYVAKIECHTNGPLFVEINCYLRLGKEETINEWKQENNIDVLGMPHYVASGSHYIKGTKYRFLIVPRYETDLEQLLSKKKKALNLKTVLTISLQLIDILQYIHSKGFVHADIKSSNILMNFNKQEKEVSEDTNSEQHLVRYQMHSGLVRRCRLAKCPVVNRQLRSNNQLFRVGKEKPEPKEPVGDQIYLLDYGLAARYMLSNGKHKKSCLDQRRAHAGTILFCSIDAHKGTFSRRSDLETLAYNIIYWLTSDLPWNKHIDNPDIVQKKKQQCISQLDYFLTFCFGTYPKFLYDFLTYVRDLEFAAEPDYEYCKNIFRNALKVYRYKNDGKFDLDSTTKPWASKPKKKLTDSENVRCKKIAYVINRTPLRSNLPIKPVLRKKSSKKTARLAMLNWSKILMDPEHILKQGRERKLTESTEGSQSLSTLNINDLNPTDAMLSIYNSYIDRTSNADGASPTYKGDSSSSIIEGYTSAMIQVHNRMIERREIENALIATTHNNSKQKYTKKGRRQLRTTNNNIKEKTRTRSAGCDKQKDMAETRSAKSCTTTRLRLRG